MKSEWSHLPNAKYIDRILSHIENDPESWEAAWRAVRAVARDAALDAARAAARGAQREAAWEAAWRAARKAQREAARGAARKAAMGAILALVAWDHAGTLLDLPAEQVKLLALLGQPAAILMYPAVSVMENTQNIRLTNNARTAIMVT